MIDSAHRNAQRLPASFRDPSGFVFTRNGEVLRQVNQAYRSEYEKLMAGGLYEQLADQGLLIEHTEIDQAAAEPKDAYKVLRPQQIAQISYPYEWCFSQLRDAALLTLRVAELALQKGMILKDASAYNVQFLDSKPILIDTLSFETYQEGAPWIAYGQFCKHFLAPLTAMAYVDIRLNQLLRIHIDGIPLDLAANLLPFRTRFNPGLGLHLHLHARAHRKAVSRELAHDNKVRMVSRHGLLALLDNLKSTISRLTWKPGGSEWFDYYTANNNYGEAGLVEKESVVESQLQKIQPRTVWDLGGNTGRFSRVAARLGARVTCWDIDPGCVESNYRYVQTHNETKLLPLLLDLTNPAPGLGWSNTEREGFIARAPVELVMALGLIHHLAIANNVPLPYIAQFLSGICKQLLIEFVPKTDNQVQKLLANRSDIFPEYTAECLEYAFSLHFELAAKTLIPGTDRTLYHFTTKEPDRF